MRPRTSPRGIFASSTSGVCASARLPPASNDPATASDIRTAFMAPRFAFCSAFHRQDRQAVEGGDRIGLGPQPDAASREPGVALVDQDAVVEPRLDAVILCGDLQLVPLTE